MAFIGYLLSANDESRILMIPLQILRQQNAKKFVPAEAEQAVAVPIKMVVMHKRCFFHFDRAGGLHLRHDQKDARYLQEIHLDGNRAQLCTRFAGEYAAAIRRSAAHSPRFPPCRAWRRGKPVSAAFTAASNLALSRAGNVRHEIEMALGDGETFADLLQRDPYRWSQAALR